MKIQNSQKIDPKNVNSPKTNQTVKQTNQKILRIQLKAFYKTLKRDF